MPQVAAIIVALILERPMCLDCVAMKASVNAIDAGTSLGMIGSVLRVRRAEDRCRVCGETTLTMVAERPQ
jgi:hypothetical protein